MEKIPKKEEVKKNTKNFYMLTNLKNDLTSYLNSNPLTKYKVFKKYAETELIKLNLNVMSNENFYKNIFYPWKKNNIMFKWYSIFNNNKTKLNDIYLREFVSTYIFPNNLKTPILHRHIIWISPFFIKQLQNSVHFYIDGTFIFPQDFKQLIVVLYYDSITNAKYPGAYILINSKLFQSYLLVFSAFKNILTKYNSIEIKLETITVDFETALINALREIFKNIKIIGCYFHYMQALDRNA